MKYAEFNTTTTFRKATDGKLYEIFVMGEGGYTPKKLLCTVSKRDDGYGKILTIRPFDKFGREIYGWDYPYNLRFNKNEKISDYVVCDEIKRNGYVFCLSRAKAYQHCMNVLREKVLELRKKEYNVHKVIFGL